MIDDEVAECEQDLDDLRASINIRLLHQEKVYQWEYDYADWLRRRIESLKEDKYVRHS